MRIKFLKFCSKWQLETIGEVVHFGPTLPAYVSVHEYSQLTMTICMEDVPYRIWQEGVNVYLTGSSIEMQRAELIWDRDAVAVPA